MELAEFSYELPRSAIAQQPVSPRDAARLLVLDGLRDHMFSDLPDLLEPHDLLVVNRTRVRASRLPGRRHTGGAAEVLLLGRLEGEGNSGNGESSTWKALVRPARKLGVGEVISAGPIVATILEHHGDGIVSVVLETDGNIEEAIEQAGEMPLPPYITTGLSDRDDYQTVFAAETGSAAAPTAGLHFTPALIDRLGSRNIEIASVVLEVGLDTFRPITSTHVEDHRIHSENVVVEESAIEAIARARVAGGRVVAVGTTAVRALESAAASGEIRSYTGPTDLYITPGYTCRVVDGLITNFHLPGTTLLVMVAALFGDAWRAAYSAALDRGYRFLSFGDAMMGWVR